MPPKKRTATKPKRSKQPVLSFAVPLDMLRALDAAAEADGRTRSSYVRRTLQLALERAAAVA